MVLWTVGYGVWPVASRSQRLVSALLDAGVTRLVDTRHSPCASDIHPDRPYGPRAWNLQAGKAGIMELLSSAGIAYEWIVELGNPEKRDPAMTILRAHLADRHNDWPVHRGLERLAAIVNRPNQVAALLCACPDPRACHRTVVAKAVAERFFDGKLEIRNIQ